MFSFKNLIKISFTFVILAVLSAFILYLTMRDELPDVNSLKNVQWQTPMQIYSKEGLLVSQFGEKKRVPLTLEQVPQQLIEALLATEDDRFYLHFGVDPIGVGRAVIGKLMGQDKGGASTITMQVARNFFLTREITYTRKLREVFLSFHIESLLTKDEILMLYINKIELGHRSFGFGAAAQVYYGKDLNELNLAQIAVLAGLPKAPSTLNPIRSPKRAKDRRAVVLQRMLVSGYISQQQYQEAKEAPITGKKHGAEIELSAPYVAEMAHQDMLNRYSKDQAYTQGYKVFTTITKELQLAAQQAVTRNLLNYDQRHGYRGPILSLRPQLEGKNLQQPNETQNIKLLTELEINQVIEQVTSYQKLQPAVVTEVYEQAVQINLGNNQLAFINWSGLSWARAFISDLKQDQAPKTAADILKYGDVILVESNSEGEYKLSQLPQASAAMVSLSPYDGAIKAAVGGFSFQQSQFNRVTQAKRQVGSNIKPFIYSAALDHGFTLASLVNDAPINQWDKSAGIVWRPKNSPDVYSGPIRVRDALARSKNVIAVRLLQDVGLDNIINHLSSFGFNPDDLPRNESLALGSASLTPLEVATGFATFANGGYLITPYLIERIEDSAGNIVYQANPEIACHDCLDNPTSSAPTLHSEHRNESSSPSDSDLTMMDSQPIKMAEQVISPQNAFLITQALNSAIWGADWSSADSWQGTGWRARALKRRDIAGKTGTTNEAKDAWFSGFNKHVVTTSWIGFDDPSRNLGLSLYNKNLDKSQIYGKEFGAKSALPAWISFMDVALKSIEVESFEPPAEIISVRIDKTTGKLTHKTDKTSRFEYFMLGTQPTERIQQDTSGEIFDGAITAEEELF